MKVGVLALQGAFAAHGRVLERLGVDAREVRTPAELADVDALVLPGGESTTMGRLLDTSGLRAPLLERLTSGLPALATCAGMILLAAEVLDGRADQQPLGVLDVAVRRNGYGRQVDSFEAELRIAGLDRPFHAVFIRAPVVERVGSDVDVLAAVDGHPAVCAHGPIVATTFHPELTGDTRLHELFLERLEREV